MMYKRHEYREVRGGGLDFISNKIIIRLLGFIKTAHSIRTSFSCFLLLHKIENQLNSVDCCSIEDHSLPLEKYLFKKCFEWIKTETCTPEMLIWFIRECSTKVQFIWNNDSCHAHDSSSLVIQVINKNKKKTIFENYCLI